MAMYYYARKLSKGPSSSHRRSKTPPPRMNVNGHIPNGQIPTGSPSIPPLPSYVIGELSGRRMVMMDPRGSFRFHTYPNNPTQQHPLPNNSLPIPPPPQRQFQKHGKQRKQFCDGCGSKIVKKPPVVVLSDTENDYFSDLESDVECKVHSRLSESAEQLRISPKPSKKDIIEKELVFNESKSRILSGSWDALLKYLVPTEEHFPSEEFIFTFLLSARLFLSPHEILKKVFNEVGQLKPQDSVEGESVNSSLLDSHGTGPGPPGSGDLVSDSSSSPNCRHQNKATCTSPQQNDCKQSLCGSFPAGHSSTLSFQLASVILEKLPYNVIRKLVQFLRFWTKLFPYDFRDEKMMTFVKAVARKSVDLDEEVREKVSQLLAPLHSRLAALEKYEEFLHRITTEASIGEPIAAPSVVTICPNPTTMAEQLTLVELQRFSFIGAEEFVQTLGKEDLETGDRTCDCQNRKTKNLEAYVLWFQRLTYYVASEICKMSKKKSRVRVIEYWVSVAKECLTLRNFNSLMAILAGLNTFPVARLKKTWTKQLYTDLAEVAKTVDPQQNYAPYKKLYKAAVWQEKSGRTGKGSRPTTPTPPFPNPPSASTSKPNRILVPYFSLLMKEVYNLNGMHPSRLPNGHLDFEKCRELAKLITEITSWQKVQCSFAQAQNIFNSVQASPIFNQQELIYASYICESPVTSREKEHFKKLHKQKLQVPLIGCNTNTSSSENDT